MEYDLIIRNGNIICYDNDIETTSVDIGVRSGKIVAIGKLSEKENIGKVDIDASGCAVAPGFIDFHSHVDCNEKTACQLVLQGATTTIGGERNFDGRRINEISEKGFLINHGFFISQSFMLRDAIGLKDPYEPATKEDIKKMMRLAEPFFEFGNYGIYFGLEMVPGTSEQEIIELSKLAKRYGRKILIHLRKDGIEVIDSVKEAIHIARVTKASIHILHLMYMAGNPSLMEHCLDLISAAIEEGLDITADTGMYEAFPTYIGSSILDGDWKNQYNKTLTYRDILISSGIYNGKFCSPKLFDFLREEYPNTLVTIFAFDEKANELALKKPYVYVSTNAGDGPQYEGIGHPETAGTFPKLIRKYVRQKKLLSLKDTLYKITYGPATRFDLKNKGNIKVGFDADIVIFDVEKIEDMARFSNIGKPDSPPTGIHYVIVNGQIVVDHGSIVTYHAGKLLTLK